ncbi:MAG: helix-turn-helix transcriptional regulator [Alphaproteobacteria bacterium]
MNVTKQHLDLIARIYDVVLDKSRWRDVLDDVADISNARLVSLFINDFSCTELEIQSVNASVYSPEAIQSYNDEIAKSESFLAQNLTDYPVGQFVSEEELCLGQFDFRDLPGVAYIKKWYGAYRRTATRLNDNGAWWDCISFCYAEGRGLMTDAERENVSMFIPHFAKAVQLGRPFHLLKARFNGVLSVLDRFHIGVLVLSEFGSVVIKNKEAERILDLDDGLFLTLNDQLKAHSDSDLSRLGMAIKAATATSQSEGDDSGSLFAVTRRSGKDSYLLEVAPLMDSRSEMGESLKGAFVFIIDPTNRARISTAGMEILYELSKTESLVCKMLVDGHETQDMADMRNVSVETIRTQVKSVLAKTRSSNRADVVRLALSVNLPIDPADEDDSTP